MLEAVGADDIPAVVNLMNRAYRGTGSSAAWNSEAAYISGDRTSEAIIRADLRNNPEAVFLKCVDGLSGMIVGCVWLEPVNGTVWYLGSLTTDPDRQNDGLGRALLAASEAWIRGLGGTRVRMTVVSVRDTLIAWYLRRGYRLTGETEPFPYDDLRFGTPLRDDLQFVVLEKELTTDLAINE